MHPAGGGRPSHRTTAAWAISIAVAALLLYARTLGHGFLLFDDDVYVHENEWVRSGLSWAAVRWAFTTFDAANWHPLTWLSHLLDAELFGIHPAGPHAVNALLHAANSALVFAVLRALTGATGRSAVVGLLFAVHPLHVESVAWIAERKDVLSTLFGLLALAAWARYASRPSPGRLAAVAAPFALSLLAKPMWVTFPFLLLLLDVWPLQRLAGSPLARDPEPPPRPAVPLRAALLEKVPLLALSAAASAVTVVAQGAAGATASLDLGVGARLANAVVSYFRYVAAALWPAGLSVFYPLRRLGAAEVALAAAALAALTAAAAIAARRRPWALVGWLWFVGTLVPVIGLVQVGMQARADRYTYLPSVGLFVVAAWGGALLLPRWPARAAAGIAIAALSVAAWVQLGHWRDHETLFRRALALAPDSALVSYDLAAYLVAAGRLGEARPLLQRTIQLDPGHARAWNDLGNFALLDGDVARAAELYGRAVEATPAMFEARYNLATALARLGRCEEARRHVPALRPDAAQARLLRRIAAAGDPLAGALRRCP